MLPVLEQALADAQETVRWTAGFELPDFERDPLMLSMYDREGYALDTGPHRDRGHRRRQQGDWDTVFTEHHVEHSTALQATGIDGRHHLRGALGTHRAGR